MTILDTATTPLTLLQAVNQMLSAVGRGPVTSTDPNGAGEEAAKAIQTISDVSVQVQAEGWYFNEEIEYALVPNPVDGTIALPLNVLSVKRSTRSLSKQSHPQSDRNRSFTMRGVNGVMYLYDLANQTYSWIANTDAITVAQPLISGTLAVEMKLAYPFEDLPQAIRWYVMAKAGNIWGVGRVPDQETYRFTQAVVDDAYSKALQFDSESRDFVPEENPHFRSMRQR